jgi:hypothetical protein
MRKLITKQDGMTGMGIMLVLVVLAGVVLIVLRIFPLYNEKFQVIAAMNTVVSQAGSNKPTNKSAAKTFMSAMALTNIERFTDYNIKEFLKVVKTKKKGEPRLLHLKYESRNIFFADIYFTLVFDKKIAFGGSDTSE